MADEKQAPVRLVSQITEHGVARMHRLECGHVFTTTVGDKNKYTEVACEQCAMKPLLGAIPANLGLQYGMGKKTLIQKVRGMFTKAICLVIVVLAGFDNPCKATTIQPPTLLVACDGYTYSVDCVPGTLVYFVGGTPQTLMLKWFPPIPDEIILYPEVIPPVIVPPIITPPIVIPPVIIPLDHPPVFQPPIADPPVVASVPEPRQSALFLFSIGIGCMAIKRVVRRRK